MPRSIPSFWLAAALISAPLAGAANAGVIHGLLRTPPVAETAASHNAYPGRASSLASVKKMPHGRAGDAVIWVEKVPASADTATGEGRPRLAQKDQCFMPRVLGVAVGTAVDFPNLDPIFHNVFSASPVKRFDLGKYPRGQSKRVVFDRPGLVNVYCDIHSDMEAFVLVVPTHVIARPDMDGAFALPPVPAGSYTVHVWQPDFGEFRREVRVPEHGDVSVEWGW